jgi:hypothetical protein
MKLKEFAEKVEADTKCLYVDSHSKSFMGNIKVRVKLDNEGNVIVCDQYSIEDDYVAELSL